MYTNMHVFLCTDLFTYAYINIYVRMHTHTNIYMYMYTHISMYAHTHTHTHTYIYIYCYVYIHKLVTVVEGDPKDPFSIASTQRSKGGRNSFPWIAPLYTSSVPYNAEY